MTFAFCSRARAGPAVLWKDAGAMDAGGLR